MSLYKVEGTDQFRLEVLVSPDTITSLDSLKITEQISITELVRRSLACFNLYEENDWSGGKIWALGNNAAHQIVPITELPKFDSYYPLKVLVTDNIARFIQNICVMRGYEDDEFIDRAVYFYGQLLDARMMGATLLQQSASEVCELQLID